MGGIIYKLTNLLNGKIYIGQTVQTLKKRFAQHSNNKKSVLGQAIQKYGKENFKSETIEECETSEKLNEREIFWIAHFDCISPKGYNLTEGGEGWTPSEETRKKQSESHKGIYPSAETRAKMSASRKGQKRTDETRKKISIAGKGKHYFRHTAEAKAKISAAGRGRIFSAETRAKIAESGRGRKHTEEAKRKMSLNRKDKKKVRCLETGEIFESIFAASKVYKISAATISGVCKGKGKTAVGYHWEFVEN